MANPKNLAAERTQAATKRNVEPVAGSVTNRLGIMAFRHQDGGHRIGITRGIEAIHLRSVVASPHFDGPAGGLGETGMTSDDVVQTFVFQKVYGFPQTVEQVYRQSADEAFLRPLRHHRPIEIMPPEAGAG